jgi:ketosteroid isomerase-like protein
MPQVVCSKSALSRFRFALPGLVAAALLLMSWPGAAQSAHSLSKARKHAFRHVIDNLEDQWREAILSDDTAKMSALLADDYMAITPWGTLENKDQTLASLRSGRWRFTSLTMSDRKVRFYGRTALVTSQAQVQGSTPEGDLSGDYLYTRVYARDPRGNWKIVNFEANRIGAARIPKDDKAASRKPPRS